MRLLLALISLLIAPAICDTPPGKDAILLSNVKTLTLRANRETSARRVTPIPQLSCVGPSKKICKLYQPEVMRCTNQGYDYDAEDVQWTCKTDLPAELKLGATDVICEGYRNADDKWILKGSCGVEYRMLLTEIGEKRYGRSYGEEFDWSKDGPSGPQGIAEFIGNLIFFGFILAVFVFILYSVASCLGLDRDSGTPGNRRGGGGGGGGPGGYPGPPPPYSTYDSSKSSAQQEGWKPGFWSGAASGAAAGYGLGRSGLGQSGGRRTAPSRSTDYDYDPGEGSSRSRSPQLSTPSTSTGFGSTRRR